MIHQRQTAGTMHGAARRTTCLAVEYLVLGLSTSALAAEIRPDGSIAATVEGIAVSDYVELRSGNDWRDVLASAGHSRKQMGSALEVLSQVNSGRLSRTVYDAPGETIYIWRLENIVAGHRRWRLDKHKWNDAQRRMMRKAGRIQGRRLVVVSAITILVLFIVLSSRNRNLRERVHTAVNAMSASQGFYVQHAIEGLEEFPTDMVLAELS